MIKRTITINGKKISSHTFDGHIESKIILIPQKVGEFYLIEGKEFKIVQGDLVEDILEAVR